jgi:hypothetical protein
MRPSCNTFERALWHDGRIAMCPYNARTSQTDFAIGASENLA